MGKEIQSVIRCGHKHENWGELNGIGPKSHLRGHDWQTDSETAWLSYGVL